MSRDDDKCFWYTEGTCFLEKGRVPEDWIVDWIQSIPAAREDILKCAMKKGRCDAVPDEYIEWAEEIPDIETEEEFLKGLQKKVNTFVDHHRKNFSVKRLNTEEEGDES
jgi:hypothetical protein